MQTFSLFAHPWWVNTAILVPVALYVWWRKSGGLYIVRRALVFTAIFALAFGLSEAAVVVHLRAATGLLPGYEGTLANVQRHAVDYADTGAIPEQIPQSLTIVELLREASTMVLLAIAAFLAHKRARERAALFFWMAALWDISYYAWLWLLIRWPISLTSPDVLFLIPVPWVSQIWFPLAVSACTAGAVLCARTSSQTLDIVQHGS